MLAFPCCFPPPTPTHSSLHQLLEKLPEGLFFFFYAGPGEVLERNPSAAARHTIAAPYVCY